MLKSWFLSALSEDGYYQVPVMFDGQTGERIDIPNFEFGKE